MNEHNRKLINKMEKRSQKKIEIAKKCKELKEKYGEYEDMTPEQKEEYISYASQFVFE